MSCSAHKADNPGAGDGVYWIVPAGTPLRAYCDMRQRVELCTELMGEHAGVTRDDTHLAYRMTSLLDVGGGVCHLWNLRDSAAGRPLDRFVPKAPATGPQTCAVLGFIADDALGICGYGDGAGRSNCGFPVNPLLRWGTTCDGCVTNDGSFDHYVIQGPMHTAAALTSADGSVQTRCRIR